MANRQKRARGEKKPKVRESESKLIKVEEAKSMEEYTYPVDQNYNDEYASPRYNTNQYTALPPAIESSCHEKGIVEEYQNRYVEGIVEEHPYRHDEGIIEEYPNGREEGFA